MAGDGANSDSRTAVVVALIANTGIAIGKFIASAATGSSAMFAEALHSVADSINEVLLLVGERRASRPADPMHQFGHGRYRYLFAFIVSLTVFWLGGVFAVVEGLGRLSGTAGVEDPAWAYGVLALAAVLEGWSLRTTVRKSRQQKGSASWREFVRKTRTPELLVVLLEDVAALLGLALAFVGVSLTVLTGHPFWDGVATILVGLLLMAVGIVIAMETQSLVVGEAATEDDITRILDALISVDGIDAVLELRTIHVSPDDLFVAARVAVDPGLPVTDLIRAIRDAQERVGRATSKRTEVFVEPVIPEGSRSAEPRS
jgi:cation diffusion facilitator family transporter